MKSLKRARKVTSSFHRITHEISILESGKKQNTVPNKERIQLLENELKEMGGREVYQQASVLTTARCSSTKWVTKTLRKRGILLGSSSNNNQLEPKVLEVGAINTELLSTSGLNVRAIDILSRDSKIEQCDFFTLEKDIHSSKQDNWLLRYDAIVCSMVINCVPNYLDRGRMLLMLRCLTPPNSEQKKSSLSSSSSSLNVGQKIGAHFGFNQKKFETLLKNIGFNIQPNDSKTTDKVCFYCLQYPKKNADENKQKILGGLGNNRNDQMKQRQPSKNKQFSGFFVALPNDYPAL
eukprot:CAMPEP_0114362534 /NCGR_PEP_ID=MMETSP0101-20121206/25737_1 /TAXON_ID=38822 ORGANISM="Pteridomonas danica, Strain PT" /NCGR_SAMPLE_ID=MMETSP0101 /ASSEMBLY_ACC=CAM_ASM_000211 /LENGTH=292 /DNA_ID=CAMNT_0001508421 /DNA_START=17 /DNA_END=895 /DNA_ORIENTATION=-